MQHQIVNAGPDLRGFFPSTAGRAGRTFRECSLLAVVITCMALAGSVGLQYRIVSVALSHRVDSLWRATDIALVLHTYFRY